MKILLSAGHGYTDVGSIGADKRYEKDRNLELTNLVANKLRQAGHEVTVKTEKTSNGSWTFKNRIGYDYALSIHFNAFNKNATGTEVLYKNSLGKANELSKAIANILGVSNRGAKKRTDLYMMNIGFDALIETCFHDNQKDLEKYNKKKNEIANKIAEIINGGTINNNSTTTKSIDELAREVIAGKYGNGDARKKALGNLYNEVQKRVNEILTGKTSTPKKSVDTIAKEVIQGKWGNGQDRKNRLSKAGYNYKEVQTRVNQLLR